MTIIVDVVVTIRCICVAFLHQQIEIELVLGVVRCFTNAMTPESRWYIQSHIFLLSQFTSEGWGQ